MKNASRVFDFESFYQLFIEANFLSRLLVASKDMEAELVCVDSYGKKAGMGVLDGGGFLFTVPLHTVRKLLNPDCALLKTLGIYCIYFYMLLSIFQLHTRV